MAKVTRTFLCPDCGGELHFIEVCSEDDVEKKTSYACDVCKLLVYVVRFK